MSEIIEFPGGKERYQREMEKIIDETLNIEDPKVKECIKKQVGETLSKHQGIPTFNVSLSLSISEEEEKILIETLSTEYNKVVSKYALGLLLEVCILQAKLCKCEYGV